MSKQGLFTRKWDLSTPGVTSISVDVHKYGFSSKGVSVCGFKDPELRRASYMPSADGCEGLYITPTLQGSRSGAQIAQAWATLQRVGDDGYREMARDIAGLVDRVKATVKSIPELKLLVEPDAAIVPISSGAFTAAAAAARESQHRRNPPPPPFVANIAQCQCHCQLRTLIPT